MSVVAPQPTTEFENGAWGYQSLDLPRKQIPILYVLPRSTTDATTSEEYSEPIIKKIESPFETIEETLPEHERIIKFLKSDLYKIRDDLEKIVTPRINELISAIDEEDDLEQSSINVNSFKNFVRFLTTNVNTAIPSFVVTYEGNIRALWRKSRKQHLAIEFHPDETATYVVFAPNIDKPEKILRSSGTTRQKNLYKVAVSLGANEWISNN